LGVHGSTLFAAGKAKLAGNPVYRDDGEHGGIAKSLIKVNDIELLEELGDEMFKS
jgi:hypothetical protein